MHLFRQVPIALPRVATIAPMSTPGERLKKARLAADYTSARAAAEAMGVNVFTYRQHENATQGRGIPADAAARYATFFRISLDWLLSNKGPMRVGTRCPVVGYIGAGAELFPVDDFAKGQGLRLVDPPPGVSEDCVAAEIRGDSMHPLREGWLVFWTRHQDGVPESCIGQLCVVKIKNGPTLLKDLHRGSRKNHFTLTSWNAPAREDVQLEWAAKVIDIRTD